MRGQQAAGLLGNALSATIGGVIADFLLLAHFSQTTHLASGRL
jgi:hypothetical protein